MWDLVGLTTLTVPQYFLTEILRRSDSGGGRKDLTVTSVCTDLRKTGTEIAVTSMNSVSYKKVKFIYI